MNSRHSNKENGSTAIAMKRKLSSFLSSLATVRRSYEEIATRVRHENQLALLKAGLFKPIETYLEIAEGQCAIDVQLRDPKLRAIFDSIEITVPTESTTTTPPATAAEMLDECERTCLRDVGFAARLAQARQELAVALREIRGKLQGDPTLHEAFQRIYKAHDALDSLRVLGSLGSPEVPPSHTLIHEADQLAALLRAKPGLVASSHGGDRQQKGTAGNSPVVRATRPTAEEPSGAPRVAQSVAAAETGTSSPFEIIIFDLDNTLVWTDALEEFRGRENVGRSDDEYVSKLTCTLSGHDSMRVAVRIPTHTLRSIRSSWPKARLAVFTRGPRRYAEMVLEHSFPEFRWDLIVAREDVAHTKPAPEGILKAMEQVGPCSPAQCVVIGDHRSDIEAAYSAGVPCAWWSAGQPPWGNGHEQEMLPDWVLKSPSDVYRLLQSPGHGKPWLEAALDVQETDHARVEVLRHWNDLEAKVLHNGRELSQSIEVNCLGRYFARGPTFVQRAASHRLTNAVLAMKEGAPAPAEIVSGLASQIALQASGTSQKRNGVVVCVIPSKAGTEPRLERLLEAVEAECRRRGGSEHILFEPAILGVKDGMASSHRLHLNKRDREINAREHIFLKLRDAVDGRHVVLLDDVVTSGATLFYGSCRIAERGALTVSCIALAKNVSPRNIQ